MDKPVDLNVIRSERRDKCMFCGSDAHDGGPLTCPRVEGVDVDPDDGSVTGVHFWAEFDGEETDPAA